ncbi:MAG: MBL fold metallo-hydrolase [Chitinophagaceae bacterium]|jgi:glyoxylase-like metal-dependent hydrolase (beta-lactamase superfamily II)|nr:MBL fold metallo-hydrolase [Chitinophagaceae bacterium]
MKIIPLAENQFTVDQTKIFVPFDPAKDNLQNRTKGSLLVEIQPFVVITSRDILLIDTGLGFKKNNELQIHANLRAHGMGYSDITKVLVSHLHKDHAGGMCFKNPAGEYELSFPNAVYYLQKQELDYALQKGAPTYIPEELAALKDNPQVVLLNGNGYIDNYIQYEITGGHCPFHQVFWLREDNQTIFYGGDEAPQLAQMKKRYIAKYDYNGRKSMELRKHWWEQGQKEKWTFLFYHDISYPVFTAG